MSVARQVALVAMIAGSLAILTAASAHAQACPTNPSGGTWLRQTAEDGSSPGGVIARQPTIHPGWQTWLGTFAASRYASSVAARPSERSSMLAVSRRSNGQR
jgi:uncharacterized protein YcnI